MTKKDYIALAKIFNLIKDPSIRFKVVDAFCEKEASIRATFNTQKFFYACDLKMEYLLTRK